MINIGLVFSVVVGLLSYLSVQANQENRTLVYTHKDPTNDEGWIYPTDAVYGPGLFDILQFDVSYDSTYTYFDISFRNVTNSYSAPYGFSHQICQIFVDSDRRFSSGSVDPRDYIYHANTFLPDDAPYEFTIYFTGWSAYMNFVENSTFINPNGIALYPETKGNLISVPVPLSLIGIPSQVWAYTVWCGSELFGEFRDVRAKESQYNLGGGADKRVETQAIDFLAYPGYNKRNTFDAYKRGGTTHINPVGHELYPVESVFSLTDPVNDYRKIGFEPGFSSSIFDILSLELLADLKHVVFRLTMGDMKESKTSAYGFENLIFQIYVDADDAIGQGSRISRFNGQFSFLDEKGWEFMISAGPDGATAIRFRQNGYDELEITRPTLFRASNNIIEVKIPKIFLESISYNPDYSVWRLACVSGIANASNFLDLCLIHDCSRTSVHPQSNIIDFLNPKNVNNNQIFDLEGTPGGLIQIPFIGMDGLLMFPIFRFDDVIGDELAFYPPIDDGTMHGLAGGLCDIVRFMVYSDSVETRLSIEVEMAPSKLESSFVWPVFQIFIDKDKEYWSGSMDTSMNSGIKVHPQNGWELCITIDTKLGSSAIMQSGKQSSQLVIENSVLVKNKTVYSFIPQSKLGSLSSVNEWSFAILSGIRSDSGEFLTLHDASSEFGFSRKYPDLPYNILDFLATDKDQKEALSSWQDTPEFTFLPFVGVNVPYLRTDGLFDDLEGDETGSYPLNPFFNGKKGLFDLLSVSIQHNSNFTRFCVRVKSLSDSGDALQPIGFLATQIYIDVDRKFKSGCSKSIGEANIIPDRHYQWEYSLYTFGNMTYLHKCNGTEMQRIGVSFPIKRGARMFYFDIPVDYLPVPSRIWNYVVVSGGVFDNQGKLVDFTEYATSMTFGGGDKSGFSPSIVDAITLNAATQALAFKSFSPPKKQFSTINPIGTDVIIASVIWEIDDSILDERGEYPTSLKNDLLSGLFDITHFQSMADSDNMILRISMLNLMTFKKEGKWMPKHLLLHIYINVDGENEKGSKTLLSNTNMDPKNPGGWEYAIVVGANGAQIHKFDEATKSFEMVILEMDKIKLEGNSISVAIPLNLVGSPQSSWSFLVLSGMESHIPWEFVPFSDAATDSSFGGVLKSQFAPNVVDVLTFTKSDQDTIFSECNYASGKKCSIPFIGGSDSQQLFNMQDAPLDEFGQYTTNEEMNGIKPSGLLDMTAFNVAYNWTHLIMSVDFRERITNPRGYALGFSLPIISIYCHDNFEVRGRYETADKSFIDLQYQWSWMVLVHGRGFSLKFSESWSGSMADIQYTALKRMSVILDENLPRIKIYVPRELISDPDIIWQYTVLVGLCDPSSDGYALRNYLPSIRFLGGGDDDYYDPNVVDVLIPLSPDKLIIDTVLQTFILSDYDPGKEKRSKVPSVGPLVKFEHKTWYHKDCPENARYDITASDCICKEGYRFLKENCVEESKKVNQTYLWLIGLIIGIFVAIVIGAFFYRKRMIENVKGAVKEMYGIINPNELLFGQKIGSGSYGQVFKGEWRGTEVAIKVLSDKKLNREQIEAFKAEISTMIKLRHPNIVLYMGASFEEPNLCILCELMHQGSLYDVLHGDMTITYSQKLLFMLDISKGMQYLHQSNPPIVHRDLKSLNILVDDRFRLKVSDFGLTTVQGSDNKNGVVGSSLWLAPEVIEGKEYTISADVYSFGIISWEIVARKDPYFDMENISSVMIQVVIKQLRPKIPQGVPPEIQNIITDTWSQNALERPSFQEIVKKLANIIESSKYSMNSSFSEIMNEEIAPPSGAVAVVSCRIFSSDALWDDVPDSMGEAVITYNKTIREESRKSHGYISQNDGENFVVAFQEALLAIRFCLDAQAKLNDVDWPGCLLEHEYGKSIAGGDLKGLRSQMGVDFGKSESKVDETSKRRQFTGKVVSNAIKIGRSASGGQIVFTDAVYQELGEKIKYLDIENIISHVKPKSSNIGQSVLRQICPKKLQKRAQLFFESDIEISMLLAPNEEDFGDGSQHPHALNASRNSINTNSNHKAPETEKLEYLEIKTSGSNQFDFELLRKKFDWEIDFSEIVYDEQSLGSGSFGSVYRGEYKSRKVAVKRVSRDGYQTSDEMYLSFLAEVSVIRKLRHSNIVEFVAACAELPNLTIVMELVEPGSLRILLLNHSINIGDNERSKIIGGIVHGMSYLHSSTPPILHRDLKPENVLITHDFQAKICDFGFARVKSNNRTMTKCGTVVYQAPEVMKGKKYDEKADVFGFGIMLWEIETRDVLYKGKNPMMLQFYVMNGLRPEVRSNMNKARVAMMQKCWTEDPELRPHFRDLKKSDDIVLEAIET